MNEENFEKPKCGFLGMTMRRLWGLLIEPMEIMIQ